MRVDFRLSLEIRFFNFRLKLDFDSDYLLGGCYLRRFVFLWIGKWYSTSHEEMESVFVPTTAVDMCAILWFAIFHFLFEKCVKIIQTSYTLPLFLSTFFTSSSFFFDFNLPQNHFCDSETSIEKATKASRYSLFCTRKHTNKTNKTNRNGKNRKNCKNSRSDALELIVD